MAPTNACADATLTSIAAVADDGRILDAVAAEVPRLRNSHSGQTGSSTIVLLPPTLGPLLCGLPPLQHRTDVAGAALDPGAAFSHHSGGGRFYERRVCHMHREETDALHC